MTQVPETVAPVTCARHKNVETYLRCSKCETPICPKCLVQTPVGARCPDCARPAGGFASATRLRLYAQGIAAGLAAGMAIGAVLLIVPLGLFSFIGAIVIGLAVGESVSKATRRLPFKGLAAVAFACAVFGPTIGQALIVAATAPLPTANPLIRLGIAMGFALTLTQPMTLLMAIIGGVIATTRVTR